MGPDAHQRMRRLSLVTWGATALAWNAMRYHYYFDFKIQDAFGMGFSLVLTAYIIRSLGHYPGTYFRKTWMIALLLIVQFATSPILDWFVLRNDLGWAFLYGYLVALGLLIGAHWDKPAPSVVVGYASLLVWVIPYSVATDQQYYYDKVVASKETRMGQIHKVRWQDEYWIHYNRKLSIASIDGHMYYEPLIHPTLHLAPPNPHVLLLGGDNGYAVKELQKYKYMELEVVPYDTAFFKFSTSQPERITSSQDIFYFLSNSQDVYDVIIVDLPDPVNPTINQYYTSEFYALCAERLTETGLLATQAGSPYLQAHTFYSILETIRASGFGTLPLHNQVPSLGEWGWVLASKGKSKKMLKKDLLSIKPEVPTRWWNQEASLMMVSFGEKGFFYDAEGEINEMDDPVLFTPKRSGL